MPKDHPITCTWVLNLKEDPTSNQAQGFHKIEGLDSSQNFSPTGQISSLCVLISNAAVNNLQFHQIDVRSAFLNALLNENICLAAPEGIDIPVAKVLHLNKAIYGLRQAPLAWYNHLAKWLVSLIKASESEIEAFQKLGLNYRSIIRALNYISTNTRPDITFAISHISQFLEQPSLKHWLASLQVLHYLYHTKEKTLNYHNKGKWNIITYADADWGNSLLNRRSVEYKSLPDAS
ncbi:hypothetical protein O181_044025 [Austropuccinia psidii MF-1]|uniref:Reverse transcriptase Ty1/copia-type domain-containing protein n=1 Tax=Austropuccinia psidii MF-1 TaxID=1389203 RepID=A0A9Q3HJS8_9BASI|nr:hypothetical protein [Austropuccinia psidii MF-1]